MAILGTNMYGTAFVSQSLPSFSEVCLERFRDNERGKQNDHKLGQEGAKKLHFLLDQPKLSHSPEGPFTEGCHLPQIKF